MTLTRIRAWARSRDTSTAVTVTNPTRGSRTLAVRNAATVWRISSATRSGRRRGREEGTDRRVMSRSEEHTSELQSRSDLVCRLLLEKKKNQIKVTDEEVQRAVVERARQFPGQEQQVWEYYRNNPQAVASLRAPIYEEKVVEFLIQLSKVTEKKVTREELYKEDDEDKPAQKAIG